VSVPDIAIAAVKVSAEDRQDQTGRRPRARSVERPRWRLQHLTGRHARPHARFGVNGSGRINAQARVTTKSGAVSAHVEAADLGLQALQPYIAQYTSMTLLKGRSAPSSTSSAARMARSPSR